MNVITDDLFVFSKGCWRVKLGTKFHFIPSKSIPRGERMCLQETGNTQNLQSAGFFFFFVWSNRISKDGLKGKLERN